MKVLITGVNGFVGRSLYKKLSKVNDVYGIYHSGAAIFPNCEKLDLTSEDQTKAYFESKIKFDTIIHLASRLASASNINDVDVITQNCFMAKNIALCAKAQNAKHLINLSTSSVYSNTDGIYDENSLTDPSLNSDCIYGLSKYNSEKLMNYFLKGCNTKLTHLRCSMIYGAGMNESHIIPTLLSELNQNNSLTLFGDGTRLLNIIEVEKLSSIILHFVHNPVSDVVNVSDECLTLNQLAKRIVEEKGNELTQIILKPEGNRSQFRLNIKKLHEILSPKN